MKIRWGAVTAVALVAAALLPSARADAVVTIGGVKARDHRPLCASTSGGAARDDGVLRVATLNALHSDTDEGDATLRARVPLLVHSIVESGADIVGLQEVTENVAFDPNNEYPQKHGLVVRRLADGLRAATGEAWSWCYSRSNPHVPFTPETRAGGGNALDDLAAANGNTPDGGDFAEGLAILTRYRVADARARRMLPRSYEALGCVNADPFCRLDATFDARQVLWGRVRTPQGFADVFTTHLAHGITPVSALTQQLQMRQALGFVNQYARVDAPADFLLGDFNSSPTSAVVRSAAAAGFVDTYALGGGAECVRRGDTACSGIPFDGEESFTKTPTRKMGERIDYVLARVRPGCAVRVPASRVIANAAQRQSDGRYLWPSDHTGFVSTVTCA